VHTPIITGNDAEGAGEAFHLAPVETQHPSSVPSSSLPPTPSEFFSRPAFLTVSHQLHLEALATAISRVYTLSPCFRAEPSLTSRHLAEFWMLEAEWAFPGSNGVLDVCDFTESLLKDSLNNVIQSEIVVESLWKTCDAKKRLSIENALNKRDAWTRMTYTEAIQELEKVSSSSSNSPPPPKFQHTPKWGRTLQSEHERWLAESLIGGPVFVTNYPKSLKPFYMRSNDDDKTVACFDLLVPHVGELIGGSVREERPRVLEAKMREAGLLSLTDDDDDRQKDTQNSEEYQWYLDLRKFGGAPHAGFGMGFERLVGWIGGVDNIRECIPMPRWAGRMLL
jgi:asparaginyl-tRNA synthetase